MQQSTAKKCAYIIHQAPQKLALTIYCHSMIFAGALVVVFTQRFIITGADLFVYHYMETNPEMFPQNVIDNICNYMIQMGHLKEDATNHRKTLGEEEECKKNFVC